ncbi:hypothetical protein VB797_11260, partial [Rivularia sp. UHCC 0363]|nr:hypothetical protein [Rivularia sp. UHCC 0363]
FIKGSQQDFIKGSQQDFIKGSQQDFIKGSQQDFIKGSQQDARTTVNSPISQKITISPTRSHQNQAEITQTRESTQVEAKPEWIETKAELIGYQKHPLEQFLALIDNAMLKIEEIFVNLANALQQLWRK